jgi:hypothetical protein
MAEKSFINYILKNNVLQTLSHTDQSIQHNGLMYLYFTKVATGISISTGPINTGRHQGQNSTPKKPDIGYQNMATSQLTNMQLEILDLLQ